MAGEIRTEEELQLLKNNWLQDGSWDIENTEGFEAHHDQLLAWRQEQERSWEERQRQKRETLLGWTQDDLIYAAMDNQQHPEVATMYAQIAIAKSLAKLAECVGNTSHNFYIRNGGME
jgi:hypothetical protein